MKSLVKVIDQEIKSLNRELTKLQRARTALTGEPIILKATRKRRSVNRNKHRTPIGELKAAILSALGDNGSMSNNEIIENMKRKGFKFSNRSVASRSSTVRSCLARLVKTKEVAKIDTRNGIVFTTKAETFQPKPSSTHKKSGEATN